MAELPPPPPPPPPPNNHSVQARARKPKTNVTVGPRPMWLPHPDQCQQGGRLPPPPGLLSPPPPLVPIWISPNPPPPVMVLPATGYEPYRYIWFRPIGPPFRLPMPQPGLIPHPHPYPQPQVNRNRALMDDKRRGTGVFLTPSRPKLPISNINSHNSSIRAMRNKQRTDETSTHQTQKPHNTNASDGNDDVVKLDEGHQNSGTPSLELSLPEEWPY